MCREALEHSPRARAIVCADAVQRIGNGRFHRSRAGRVRSCALTGQPQHGASPVTRVVDAIQQLLLTEALQDAGERAGVDVERRGEIAG
jgi:hypothetical protein